MQLYPKLISILYSQLVASYYMAIATYIGKLLQLIFASQLQLTLLKYSYTIIIITGNFEGVIFLNLLKSITPTTIKLFYVLIHNAIANENVQKQNLQNLIYHGFWENFCFENNPLYPVWQLATQLARLMTDTVASQLVL